MKLSKNDFLIKECTNKDLEDILNIQQEAFELLNNSTILRKNSPETLLECLTKPNITLGAWYNGELAGFAVMIFPEPEENLADDLINIPCKNLKFANYKLCIVKEKFRGNSLQYELGKRLIEIAQNSGVQILCCTVSPENPYSIRNVEKLGFSYNRTLPKYGFIRNLYYKMI